jgi:hypothetical protein
MAGGDAIISWGISDALEQSRFLASSTCRKYKVQTGDEETNPDCIRTKLVNFRIKLRIKLQE